MPQAVVGAGEERDALVSEVVGDQIAGHLGRGLVRHRWPRRAFAPTGGLACIEAAAIDHVELVEASREAAADHLARVQIEPQVQRAKVAGLRQLALEAPIQPPAGVGLAVHEGQALEQPIERTRPALLAEPRFGPAIVGALQLLGPVSGLGGTDSAERGRGR
ncbi:MAG: hypothetical protein ABW217_00510 [Polyangiaceae bacterium]